ncbi:hypothetical protein [Methylomonas methanica]|uniref:Uncharacterized protein n=1 Tax=Methylomonas methanica (strain DSM 25384 / MC09) TaxID=857087 RepID=F9ZWA6_METMM|nr:hypothetical protein [Methylomonas methanica]AEG02077.1 hypothetical protein Metme_3719 [Methylomonas methanica MC09]
MPEINLDDANSESRALAMLQAVQKHHALVKANRFLLMLVFALMVMVFVMGLVLMPKQNRLNELKANQAEVAAYALQNPAISAEINTLKGQLFGLVSGSIESKLRSLEENIKRGSVADSLNTIQDLKSDVKVLSGYTNTPQLNTQKDAVNQQLIKEITDLKDLVYLTFISCGLMVAALAGVWLRHRYRLTHQRNQTIYLGRSRQD